MVSSLRVSVKKAKVCAIHKLTTKIKHMRKKKGNEAEVKTNNKKADKLMEELQLIKKLNLDKVTKFSLGNTLTLQSVATQYVNDLEMKALVRLSLEKPLLVPVTKWRNEHDDWRSLAAYIVQHTARKYKPKDTTSSKDIETKPKFKHQQRSDQSVLTSGSAQPTNDDDSSYHSNSSDNNDAVENESESENEGENENESESNSDMDNEAGIQRKRAALLGTSVCTDERTKKAANKKSKSGTLDSVAKQGASHGKSEEDSENDKDNIFNQINNEEVSDSFDSETLQHATSPRSKKDKTNKSKNNKAGNKKENTSMESNAKGKVDTQSDKQSGDMVVKKLDLQAFAANDDDADISFLFTGSKRKTEDKTEEVVKRKKPKGAFFITDDGDSEGSQSGEESDGDAAADSDEEQQVSEARRAMHESTFLGSLAGKAKKFKDFAAIRKEKRGQKKQSMGFQKSQRREGASFGQKKHAKSFADSDKKGPRNRPMDKPVPAASAKSVLPGPEEKLHPSWEAKRKRKLEQSSIPAFSGKKFTFDD